MVVAAFLVGAFFVGWLASVRVGSAGRGGSAGSDPRALGTLDPLGMAVKLRAPPRNPPARSAIWPSGPRALGSAETTSMVSAIRRGRSMSSGLASVSANRLRPGATRSTGSRSVAIIREAVSADVVICGSTTRIGSSTSSRRRFTRTVMALRLSMVWRKVWTASMKAFTPVRNWSTDFDIAVSGLLDPNRVRRSPRPGGAGRGGGSVPAMAAHVSAAAPPVTDHWSTAYSSIGGQEQTRLRSPPAASIRPTGGKYLVERSPATGKAASSRG